MAVLSACFLFIYPISLFFLIGVLVRLAYDRGLLLAPGMARPLELIAAACCIRYASVDWFLYTRADLASALPWKIMASTACYFYLAVLPGSITSRLFGSREILYLGTVSYSLYLVHPYTYYLCRMLFVRLGWFAPNILSSIGLFFLVVVPLTLLVTHVVHRLIEMKPYEYFFHQRIYRSVAK